jgi:hypothetical protein
MATRASSYASSPDLCIGVLGVGTPAVGGEGPCPRVGVSRPTQRSP